jgi:uncharacterized cupin superfamily protein
MPKIDIDSAPVTPGSGYPPPHAAAFAGRLRRRLGDAAGLTKIGVNLTTLPPGVASSLRHWHEVEDEMVFVVDGEVALVDDAGETVLRGGDAAGFRAGDPNGHHLVNRSDQPATILEIGIRPERDVCHYADHDLVCHDEDGQSTFTRRGGRPLAAGEDA